jgi:hypothetical protein
MVGKVDCGNGEIGDFVATEITANGLVLGVQATANYRECHWSGRFGGVRLGAE